MPLPNHEESLRLPTLLTKWYKSRAMAGRTARCRCTFPYVYWILQRHHAVSLPQHGVLVWAYISDRSDAEITYSTLIFTAVTQNHGDSGKSPHTTKIALKSTVIVNTW